MWMVEVITAGLIIFADGDDMEGLGMGTRLSGGSITFFVNLCNAEDRKKCTDVGFTVVYNFKRGDYLAAKFYGKLIFEFYSALDGVTPKFRWEES